MAILYVPYEEHNPQWQDSQGTPVTQVYTYYYESGGLKWFQVKAVNDVNLSLTTCSVNGDVGYYAIAPDYLAVDQPQAGDHDDRILMLHESQAPMGFFVHWCTIDEGEYVSAVSLWLKGADGGQNCLVAQHQPLNISTNGGNIDTDTSEGTGGYIQTDGGRIDSEGGRIESGGGVIDSEGGDIESGGGDVLTQTGYVWTGGGEIHTEGGDIWMGENPIANGNIYMRGGEIHLQAGFVDGDGEGFIFNTQPIAARVYHSANIECADNTWTGLTFDSEAYDPHSLHSTVTSPWKLTVPEGMAGVYHIFGNVIFDTPEDCDTRRGLRIRLNGSTVIACVLIYSVDKQGNCAIEVSTDYYLSAGDYVQLQAYQDSGAALDVLAASAYSPVFGMHRVA